MSPQWQLLCGYLVFVNLCSFAAYGIDKYKAKKSKWRIPESTLILLAYFGGALGAFGGMRIFHPQKRIYCTVVPDGITDLYCHGNLLT